MSKALKFLSLVAWIVFIAGCAQKESAAPIDSHTPQPLTTSTSTPIPPTATLTLTSIPTPVPTEIILPTPLLFDVSPELEPDTEIFAQIYGGDLNDMGYDILLLEDGGTLIVGKANNTGPSHRINSGNGRVIRTDAEGNVIWQRDYGGDLDSLLYSPIQTGDDEFVILGEIAANYVREEEDLYLIKIDGEGNEIWAHTYGGPGNDVARMVRQTSDGGFILVGDLADAHPTDDLYQSKVLLIKTDPEGNEIWRKTYGEKILYIGWAVVEAPDGGFVVTGWEARTYDDRDVIIFKTDQNGALEWYQTWNPTPEDWDGGYDMILTEDGHVVVSCITALLSERRAALIKFDLAGNEIWAKHFEVGVQGDTFWDIMEDGDGGYVMAGYAVESLNLANGKGELNGLILKTDQDGNIIWQHTFSSSEAKAIILSSAVLLPEGGYIFIGSVTRVGKAYSDMLWLKVSTVGGMIAFTSERNDNADIYTISERGKEIQQLTDHPAYDGWPSWSPDGSQIVFMSLRSGNPDLYVMDADGSNQRQLTFDDANDIWPEWSPDGTRIAFPSRRDGNFEIYTINPDGTNLQRLTNTTGHEDFPSWSPDGRQIIFSRSENDQGTFLINADGSGEIKLLDFIILEPSWSPDGSKIVFGSNHEGFRGVYVMDADGSNLQRLSVTRSGENCPSWSPDGTKIVFASWRLGDGEIYIMDEDGRNPIQLTHNQFEDEFPAWQPVP
jgi:Tol biopolymer transport system component